MAINKIDKSSVNDISKIGKKPVINKKPVVDNTPSKLDVKEIETQDTSVSVAANVDIDDFAEKPAEQKVETPVVVPDNTENEPKEVAQNQNAKEVPAQEQQVGTAEKTDQPNKTNAPDEPVKQTVQEEVQPERSSDLNELLSKEEIQKIYDEITNAISDPAQREQALKNTGINFSVLFEDKSKRNDAGNNDGNPIESAIQKANDWAEKAVADAKEWVKNAAADTVEWVENAVEDVEEWLKNAAGNTGEWIENAVNNVGEWIKNVANAPGEWLQNAVNDTGDWIQNAVDNVEEWLKNAANNTGEWIENAANDVGNWLKNAAGNVGDFFKNIFSGKKEPDEKISVENQTVEAANILETNPVDNDIKVQTVEELRNAAPGNISENAGENSTLVSFETVQDSIRKQLGDVIFEQDGDKKYQIKSSDGQEVLGYFCIDDLTGMYAGRITNGNKYATSWYEIDTEGKIKKTDSQVVADEFFQDFANEYDKETGKFKEDGNFSNGMEDVINYLNSSPELAKVAVGAIALACKVDKKDLAGSLVKDLINSNILDSEGKLKDYVSVLAEYLGEESEKGYEDNKVVASWQLESVVTNLLEKTGNTDLLRNLNQNQNLNMDTLAYLVGAADTREDESIYDVFRSKNTQSVDGELFDKYTQQGKTGDCWLLSSLITSVNNEQMKGLVENLVTIDEQNKIYTVTINGENYSYTFEELGMAKDLSRGDADVRAFEMAVRDIESKRGQNFNNGGTLYDFVVDITGGNTDDLDISRKDIMHGQVEKSFEQAMQEIKSGDYLIMCHSPYKNNDVTVYDENGNKVIAVKDKDGTEHSFVGGHGYAVLGADDEYVYIKNPWNSNQKLKITIEDYKKLGYASVSVEKFKGLIEQANKNAEMHKEQMDYYNELIESYGDKEITKADMDKIISALADKGIDYYKDIAKANNPYSDDAQGEKSANYQAVEDNAKPNILYSYRADGTVSKKEQFEYDENGNVTRETVIEYNSDGSIMTNLKKSYTYDEQGNMVRGYSEYAYGNQQPSSYSQTKFDSEGNQITVNYSFSTHEEMSRTVVDKDGNKSVSSYADGSSRVIEYQTVDGNKVPKSDITYDENNEVVSDYEYNNDGTINHLTNYSNDERGYRYKYYTDGKTGEREIVQITNGKGETFVIKNYVNSAGSLDWDKLEEDGWGISLSGEVAQYAFEDLKNGASIEEIMIKYRRLNQIMKTYNSSSGDNFGVSWEPWRIGGGGYLPDGTYSPIAETSGEYGHIAQGFLGVGMHEGGQGGSLVQDSFSSFGSGGASSGGTQLVPADFYFH